MLLTVGTLLGGLGLFMLAVTMITDGLKLAAGDALKDILGRYTSTPGRGVLSGILITGLVQSSSAVTVATIGFVNAGLLTLGQSLGVVYGANIGTTMTGWLVAAVGFDFKIEALALPLVGLGMAARLVGQARRVGAVGEALAGFGLFFIGIGFLRDAFAGVTASVDVAAFAPEGPLGMLAYVGVGFLMTLITQSSSAAIALTLTAASGGALALDAAAATVIGANVGTTSTAALATLGATANARRVAAAHVVFNGVTGLVALVILPAMLWLTRSAGTALGIPDAPAATLALFHTTFNVLGVVLMWPFTRPLANFLAGRFVTRAEALSRPQFLDRTVLVAPALALEALKRELGRAAAMARELAAAAVSREGHHRAAEREQRHALTGLLDAVEGFVTDLEGARLPAEAAAELPVVLRIANYLEDVSSLADDLETHRGELAAVTRPPVLEAITGFQSRVLEQLTLAATVPADRDALHAGQAALTEQWHELKTTLLTAASRGEIRLASLNDALEALRTLLKMSEQLTKVALRFAVLGPATAPPGPPPGAVGTAEAAVPGPALNVPSADPM